MKNIIHLTDTEARIARIENKDGIVTVELEWGGPDDNLVDDFDLAKLGKVSASGSNGNAGRTGWAVLDGSCKLNEGDTIPVLTADEE